MSLSVYGYGEDDAGVGTDWASIIQALSEAGISAYQIYQGGTVSKPNGTVYQSTASSVLSSPIILLGIVAIVLLLVWKR
jgi:quinol-cytochrome oxidoreductase complex cytochrome b subunit